LALPLPPLFYCHSERRRRAVSLLLCPFRAKPKCRSLGCVPFQAKPKSRSLGCVPFQAKPKSRLSFVVIPSEAEESASLPKTPNLTLFASQSEDPFFAKPSLTSHPVILSRRRKKSQYFAHVPTFPPIHTNPPPDAPIKSNAASLGSERSRGIPLLYRRLQPHPNRALFSSQSEDPFFTNPHFLPPTPTPLRSATLRWRKHPRQPSTIDTGHSSNTNQTPPPKSKPKPPRSKTLAHFSRGGGRSTPCTINPHASSKPSSSPSP